MILEHTVFPYFTEAHSTSFPLSLKFARQPLSTHISVELSHPNEVPNSQKDLLNCCDFTSVHNSQNIKTKLIGKSFLSNFFKAGKQD